jgi:lipopolysaccharide export LptBFGC system permease protein LptF
MNPAPFTGSRVQKMTAFFLWSISFLVIAAVVFLITAKLALSLRVAVALVIWLLPTAILTAWVIRTGDKSPRDAITVVSKSGAASKKSAGD